MDTERWQTIKDHFADILELKESDRAARLSAIDEDIRDEVARLLDAHLTQHGFIDKPVIVCQETPSSQFPSPGDEFCGLRIIEKIGEGGMGVVFLAEQSGEGFNQRVALKLVKNGLDSRSVQRRFLNERALLARLQHPNIARLIDGGSADDGTPFFVMEYVVGENIRDYCRSHRLDSKAKLRLFQKVARGVSHAHRNLVVHRDIKPSNIIVTADGEPKLLDFGIAKLISPEWHDDRDSTQTFSRPLTPEYASPEQIRGGATTTLTDVYSLGIVLYEMLTNRRPFDVRDKNIFEISNAVLTEEPLRPSAAVVSVENLSSFSAGKTRINADATKTMTGDAFAGASGERPDLRGDLDNILLKAIAKESGDRYQSVAEFSDDIDRYLSGLPVQATAPSKLYRLRKFVARHRATSAVSVGIILLSVFSAWQAVSATRARRDAEHRFNEVRQLAKFVIFDYQDGVRNLTGATSIREKMVDDGAVFLDRLVADQPDDPELRLDLARAYDRLGEVKGSFFSPSLANSTKAREFYEKSLAIKTALVAESPSDPIFHEELAQTFDRLGDLAFGNADQTASVAFYRKAVEIREAFGAATSSDADERLRLARGYRNIGVRGRSPDNTAESLELCRHAISLISDFVPERAGDPVYADANADFAEGVAAILETSQSRRSEAIAEYRRVIEMRRQNAERFPSNATIAQKYGMTYSYLGDTYYELDAKRESLAEYRSAIAILEPLTITDPENGQLQQDFAAVTGSLAITLAELGDSSESILIFEKVLRAFDAKLARDPLDKTTHFRLAMGLDGIARALLNKGRDKALTAAERSAALEKAIENFTKSREIFEIYRDKSQIFPAVNVDVEKALTENRDLIEAARSERKKIN